MRKALAVLVVMAVLGGVIGYAYYKANSKENDHSAGDCEESRKECGGSPEQVKYGKPPEFNSESDRQNWLARLDILGKNIEVRGLLSQYFYPDGPITAYGYDDSGYFVVTFEKCSEVDRGQMDTIYEIIKEEAEKLGMEKVPVLFRFETFPSADNVRG